MRAIRSVAVSPRAMSVALAVLVCVVIGFNANQGWAVQARQRPAAVKPKPAFELKALSATRGEVALSWAGNAPKAAAFVVERKSGRNQTGERHAHCSRKYC